MDIREYLDMADDKQDILFNEMSSVLIKETFTPGYIYSLVYNEFNEVGFELKDYDCEYEAREKNFFCRLNITKNDCNLAVITENLFTYSLVAIDEYELLRDEIVGREELESSMYFKLHKVYKECCEITLLLDITNPIIAYILETTIDGLLDCVFDKIVKQIEQTHTDLESRRIYTFNEYSSKYDVKELYNKLFNESEGKEDVI